MSQPGHLSEASAITQLKGVGAHMAGLLHKLGVRTVGDLIALYPRRYDDYSHVTPVRKLKPGIVTIEAKVSSARGRYVRRGLHITEAIASDTSGSVRLTWFNQPYRASAIKAGASYYISGDFAMKAGRLSLTNPSMELASDFPINTARIVPIYRETKGLKSSALRKLLAQCLGVIAELPETLPLKVRDTLGLMSRAQAVTQIHFPASHDDLAAARERLGFEEVFELSMAGLLNRSENGRIEAPKITFNQELAKTFVGSLPFTLTDGQRAAVWQIYQDMSQPHPMNRLIEGDVGSGKTVVAAMAALMVMNNGFQVALMAPTELLARQHASTIFSLLEPLGMHHKVGLLVGSLKPQQKKLAKEAIKKGDMSFLIGTHALIQESVNMHKLGLVIVDEQHRFGVEQRKALMAKAGHGLHILNMTATPIPRSLALTLYGELDVTQLTQKPNNRLPITTQICSPNSRESLYKQIDKELEKGRQMFVVTPLIAESTDEMSVGQSAEKVFKDLKHTFTHRRVGLLHGKQKADVKNETMEEFLKGDIDILVATTVIEVGVDVPNASIMLIESAERFGLAQLHQLRGRVGRGEHQGTCYLMLSDSKEPSRRLRALESSNDGFRLAELDLEIRGPGAIYGTMQHGALDLRIATLSDLRLITQAKKAAEKFLASDDDLLHYPQLASRIKRLQAVTHLN